MVSESSPFDRVISDYTLICEELRRMRIPEKDIERLKEVSDKTSRRGGRICIIGTGRTEIIAEIATKYFLANDFEGVRCSSDSSYPLNYQPNDLIVAISGSGGTKRSVMKAYPSVETEGGEFVIPDPSEYSGPSVIAITANKDSFLANFAEKVSGGFVINIEAQHKDHEPDLRNLPANPLKIEGTESELKSLQVFLDFFGSFEGNLSAKEFHSNFFYEVEKYPPNPEVLKKAYELFPKPETYGESTDLRGTFFLGEGISGRVAKLAKGRYMHLAKPNQVRRVKSDIEGLKKGDVVVFYSVSGENLPYENSKKAKQKGAKIIAYTHEGSPLSEISDVAVNIPNRKMKKPKGALYHRTRNPIDSIPEFVALYTSECFVLPMMELGGLTPQYLKHQHSIFT